MTEFHRDEAFERVGVAPWFERGVEANGATAQAEHSGSWGSVVVGLDPQGEKRVAEVEVDEAGAVVLGDPVPLASEEGEDGVTHPSPRRR